MDYIRETVAIIKNYDNLSKSIENLKYRLEDCRSKLEGFKGVDLSGMPVAGAIEPDDALCNLLYEEKVLQDNIITTKKEYLRINKQLNGLSDKERELIIKAYTCDDKTDTLIATELNITRQTFYNKKKSIIKKLAIQLWGIKAL